MATRAADPSNVTPPASLRVAVVTDAVYPYHMGGKEVRYRHVVDGLAEQGVEVHVFTMHWWEGPAHRTEGRVRYHAICRRYPLYSGHRRSVLEAVMFSLACLRLLGYRYDLIEADHMPHLPLFTIRLVAWLRRVPLVVTWHEYWGLEYWRQYLGRPGIAAAAIERLTMRLGDAVLTPSAETAARLAAHGLPRERVTVVPNGLDLDLIAATPPSPLAFDLLFVGRLVEHKHVDVLLEAVGELRRAGSALTCGIVGEGPERAALEERARRLGLGEHVHFLGTVADHADVFGLMKAARLFVLPSTREGFGIVVAEAMACGLAVVTTDHEDNHARALVEPGVTGWLCAAAPRSLAKAVEAALAHAGEVALPQAAGLERFAWQASVTSILEVFARVQAARAGDTVGPGGPPSTGRPRDDPSPERPTRRLEGATAESGRPRISVVIASRDGSRTLAACLQALEAQTCRSQAEVIVVDDGSRDETAGIARRFGVRLVAHGTSRGVSAARNSGIAVARAPVVAFTDDDCIPSDGWLAAHLDAHRCDGVAGVGGPVGVARVDSLTQHYLADHDPLAPLELELEQHPSLPGRLALYVRRMWHPAAPRGRRAVYAFPSANMSFKRDVLETVGGFDTRLTFGGEDEDLCRRVRERWPGAPLRFEPRAVVAHDYAGTLRDLWRRNAAYGKGHARAYLLGDAHRWPIVFPLPLAALVGTFELCRARRAALVPLLLLVLFPQGVRSATRHRKPVFLAFAGLRLAEESAHDVGMLVGLLQERGGRRRRRPR